MSTHAHTQAAQAQRFLIEGRDEGGHWSAETVGPLVVEYQTEAAAEAAIADLVRTLGWDRARLRVVEAGA